jgi:surfactin synthase thioesterase subunit
VHRIWPASRTPYLTATPAAVGRPILLCFPHAGGAASVFRPLARLLAGRVNVLPVQLPGREGRRRDPLPADMAALITEIDESLDPYLDAPHAFYGHSMGGLIAHDLAGRRRTRGGRPPLRLLVGACRAPHLPAAFASARLLSDRELRERMIAIGGMSEQLLSYPDWIDSAVALTRGDLQLCASRGNAQANELPYPIDAFYGAADPLVSVADVAAWAQHTSDRFSLHKLSGGHFFHLGEQAVDFAATIEAVLTQDTSAPVDRWPPKGGCQ